MGILTRFWAWLTRQDADPEALEAARRVRDDYETTKTGALDAPPMLQGQKWPVE